MGRYVNYNPNPAKNRTGDCTVRALAKALGLDWNTTYISLCLYGFMACEMPTANSVWGEFLKSRGFKRYVVDDHGQECYTVSDFCVDNPKGTFVLALSSHVVAVCDGHFFDTFDSGYEIPIYYWKREEEA